MPDITINFRTENLTRSEREKLLRDIAILKREFSEAQRAANDFGQQTQRTLELVTQIPNVINPVVRALTAAQDDAHQELQQQETQIAGSLQSQRTAIAAQRPTLEAKITTLETQLIPILNDHAALFRPSGRAQRNPTRLNAQKSVLEEQKNIFRLSDKAQRNATGMILDRVAMSTSTPNTRVAFGGFASSPRPTVYDANLSIRNGIATLNAQKDVLEKQKTIVQSQKTDFEAQIPVIDRIMVTTKRVNRELREQVDLAGQVTAEVARRNTEPGRRDFQSRYNSGSDRRDFQSRYNFGFGGRDFQSRYSDNRRPTVLRPATPVRNTLFDLTQQQILQKPTTVQRQVNTEVRELPTHIQSIVNTLSNVPSETLSFAYDALIEIPAQTRVALQQLKTDTEQNITEIKDSEVLSAREKAKQIEAIEKNAAKRRKAIEQEASQAKIASFNRVVDNFIGGIGRMIAEQVKLRVATSLTNTLLGSSSQGDGSVGIGGLLGSVAPLLAVNPAVAIGGGVALGAAALFSSSFDDPVNDALARRAGIQASQRRATQAATALGRRSAVDLKDNFEQGFVSETARQTSAPRGGEAAPVIMNEIKLVIGVQELKAIYEETQRQITTGVIAR